MKDGEYTTVGVALICITCIIIGVLLLGGMIFLIAQSQDNDKKNDVQRTISVEYQVDACNKLETESTKALCIVAVKGK